MQFGALKSFCEFSGLLVFMHDVHRVFHVDRRARATAHGLRNRRAERPARGAQPAASIATFAALIRIDLARRAAGCRHDAGRDFSAPMGLTHSEPPIPVQVESCSFCFLQNRSVGVPAGLGLSRAHCGTQRLWGGSVLSALHKLV